jgi:hypothetical protein
LFGNGAAASTFAFLQDLEERKKKKKKKKKKKRNNSVATRGTVFDSSSSKTWRSLRVDPSSQSEVITKQEDRTNHRELWSRRSSSSIQKRESFEDQAFFR